MIPGTKATEVKKKLKLLMYGKSGVGKTLAAIQFPSPYLLDIEKGAQHDVYVKELAKHPEHAVYSEARSVEEIMQICNALKREKHNFKTLIIDSLTWVYENLKRAEANALKSRGNKDGKAFYRHRLNADEKTRELVEYLLELDMNIIVICHATEEKGEDGTKTGDYIPNCMAGIEHMFDIALYLERKKDGPVKAVPLKSRIENVKLFQPFNFTFEEMAKRYDESILNTGCEPTPPASEEQVEKMNQLAQSIDEVKVLKALDKAGVQNLSQLDSKQAAKFIDFYEQKVG